MVDGQPMDEDAFLGTDVTWEDIESELRAALNTTATFGPKKSVINIGDGKGYMSKVGLVDPDWQHVSDSEILPGKFVVKIASLLNILAMSARLATMRGEEDGFAYPERKQKLLQRLQQIKWKHFICNELIPKFFGSGLKPIIMNFHNGEVAAYGLLNSYSCKLPIAKVYCSKIFSENNKTKGFMIMDYAESEENVEICDNLSLSDVRKILPIIASLQVTSLLLSDEERSEFPTNPIEIYFSASFTEKTLKRVSRNLLWFETEKAKELAKLVDEKIAEIATFEFYDKIPEQLGIKRVLSHGDLWPSNCIWRRNDEGLELKAILDWQLTNLSTPAADCAKFFCTQMSGDDRRNYTDTLLEEFYEIFREMVRKVNKELPYTLEQLKESYKRLFPIIAAITFPLSTVIGRASMEKISSTRKERARHALYEKITCLVEDMLYYHNRNIERKLL